MRVLFLDFDGVLNLYPNPSRSGVFHKPCMYNLEMLLKRMPDVKIVVSSSWRTYGLDAMKDILKSNGVDPRKVIDITGHERTDSKEGHRGYHIQCWLDRNPSVKTFAIVDDNGDLGPLVDKLVKTNKYSGLSQANVEGLLRLLDKK